MLLPDPSVSPTTLAKETGALGTRMGKIIKDCTGWDFRIWPLAALTGLSYSCKTLYGRFAGAQKGARINEVTVRRDSTVFKIPQYMKQLMLYRHMVITKNPDTKDSLRTTLRYGHHGLRTTSRRASPSIAWTGPTTLKG